ncbi:hypothetical protein PanWU01x14_353070 [Parasponia andersonii]|uniref:Uncharacterized protein n=1 Tax=Parasponia andersonii TaxID=3476 RepID=A0A2P5AA61_PARAD|nr:hypothetical protein PanWU01x14_353070 [Parasponia andersonii]
MNNLSKNFNKIKSSNKASEILMQKLKAWFVLGKFAEPPEYPKKIGFDSGEPCLGERLIKMWPPTPLAGFGDDGKVERLLWCLT